MSEADVAPGKALDPFQFFPGVASRIAGLGGTVPGTNPEYAFHTAYVEVAPGFAEFTVVFDRLTARKGTLMLRVHMLPGTPGAHAILATSLRAALNRVVAGDGRMSVRFEAFRGMTYALYGAVLGETDGHAHGATIHLDRPAGIVEPDAIVVDPRTSDYGRDVARPIAHMISVARPGLADPVCQVATLPQLREAPAGEWLRRPALAGLDDDARRWSAAYMLQTLSRFGMLAPGARGLGLGLDAAAIAAIAAEEGAATTLLLREGEEAPSPAEGVAVRAGDPRAMAPDIVDYDFAWSALTASTLGGMAAGVQFLRDLIGRLRPGGLMVHVMAFNLDAADERTDYGPTTLYRRRDLERIALTMISLKHEAAQIKIDVRDPIPFPHPGGGSGGPPATLCGIVLRKAASVL